MRTRIFSAPHPALSALLLLLLSGSLLSASAQSDRDVRLYEDAITTLQRTGDPIDLQRFASTAPFGHLKDDALQWLIWQYRSAHDGRAHQWAQQLLKIEPENALALAAVADAEGKPELAVRALRNLDQLKPPQGMQAASFASRKAQLAADLNGSVGYWSYLRKDLVSARTYLRRALSTSATNPQYTYALAVADLYGPNPDEREGFEMLARAVNLTRGTAQGAQLAAFARDQYMNRGGSLETWNQFLANTATGVVIADTQAVSAQNRANTVPPQSDATVTAKNAPPAGAPSDSTTTNAAALETVPPGFPIHARRPFTPPQAPFSLGILLETAKTSPGSRRAVVNSLTDMVRHLREDDEAFVVSFSKQVVFEQDLTDNPRALQSAIDSIKPNRGTALLDAVAFAAGHLSRIAKNQKKVLLVISDGLNQNEQTPPLEVVSELDGSKVEIYCIGMGADSPGEHYQLQALAQRTGGQALFVDDGSQFRRATQQVAANLGIRFP